MGIASSGASSSVSGGTIRPERVASGLIPGGNGIGGGGIPTIAGPPGEPRGIVTGKLKVGADGIPPMFGVYAGGMYACGR